MNKTDSGPRSRLPRLSMVIALTFIAVAGALIYWSVIRSAELLARDDNPRLVERVLRLQRGTIFDAQNVILAETVGPASALRRQYPINTIGPAVGYYSFRHGTAGIEEGYDRVLRGESDDFWGNFWRFDLRHETPVGRDIRLTLRSTWQQVADALLGDQNGAVVLLSVPDGQVLAMASHPGYDPSKLDDNFDRLVTDETGPLLNRATQGQYQPGMVVQPFVLAAAVAERYLALDDSVIQPNRPVFVNGQSLQCAAELPEPATWHDILQQRCPGPMQSLAGVFGSFELAGVFSRLGFYSAPPLPIATESAAARAIQEPELAIIGQENLTVSPMQLALALVGLANGGRLPHPSLVQAVQNEAGEWQLASEGEPIDELPVPAGTAEAAAIILQAMPQFRGISEYATSVLSGPEGTNNVWYLGLAPAGQPRFAVVVIVEDNSDLFAAQRIGRTLLSEILEPTGGPDQ
jgi:penicillin-binding protein A